MIFGLIYKNLAMGATEQGVLNECTPQNTWNPFQTVNDQTHIRIESRIFKLKENQYACIKGSFVMKSNDNYVAYYYNGEQEKNYKNPFLMHSNYQEENSVMKLTCNSKSSCSIQVILVNILCHSDQNRNDNNVYSIFTTKSKAVFSFEYEEENSKFVKSLIVNSFGPYRRKMEFESNNTLLNAYIFDSKSFNKKTNEGNALSALPYISKDQNFSNIKTQVKISIKEDKSTSKIDNMFPLDMVYVLPTSYGGKSKEEVEDYTKNIKIDILQPSNESTSLNKQTLVLIAVSCVVIILIAVNLSIYFVIVKRRRHIEVKSAKIDPLI